ncbi:hypothetical protein AB0I46_40120, partial [Streptomyces spectabilis]|uniref:hypothetical protein n=1 Tax=Streptomyces spectabilis TaxID=68270 RepID=UPI0033F26F32
QQRQRLNTANKGKGSEFNRPKWVTVQPPPTDGEFADRATALTDAAETDSEHTCEACGEPGRIRLRGDGPRVWMQASCGNCRVPVFSRSASPPRASGPK